MKTETAARILIRLYPILLIALCLWGWQAYTRSARVRDEIETAAVISGPELRKPAWASEENISELKDIARSWREKTGLGAADVQVLLEDAARGAGVRMTNYSSRGKVDRDGYSFESGDMTVRGSFARLQSLLSTLEKHPDNFIDLVSIAFRPAPRTGDSLHEMNASVYVLLDRAEAEPEKQR